jgi:hypothetical protein
MDPEAKKPIYGTLYIKNLVEEVRGIHESDEIIKALKRFIPASSNYEFSISHREGKSFCKSNFYSIPLGRLLKVTDKFYKSTKPFSYHLRVHGLTAKYVIHLTIP